jgi:hypothetical protein
LYATQDVVLPYSVFKMNIIHKYVFPGRRLMTHHSVYLLVVTTGYSTTKSC